LSYERRTSLKKRRRVALASFLAWFAACSRAPLSILDWQITQNSVSSLCDLLEILVRKTPSLRLACFLYNGCDTDTASMSLAGTKLPG